VLSAHTSDLGGSDNISEAERSLIRRATTLTIVLERLETKFAEHDGEASNTDLIASSLRRILGAIGLQRRARDVTPSLDQYLANKRSREAENADDHEVVEEGVT
jgi:hypothetical protein